MKQERSQKQERWDNTREMGFLRRTERMKQNGNYIMYNLQHIHENNLEG